ncbi:hypothetical protein [Streptomyces sp. NPDC051561]|uniref:hypothetical protein n=1 Tax=Streptomyces sp. NPDC051561 TaxID=3365658 RepID=UPI0037B069BA
MPAAPRPHLTALRHALVALLVCAAVFALPAGAGADSPSGTELRPGAVSSGAVGEGEGVPDGSTDAESRFQPGQVRRTHAPSAQAVVPAPFAAPRPPLGPPVIPVRTAPAKGPAPYAARCAVLRC